MLSFSIGFLDVPNDLDAAVAAAWNGSESSSRPADGFSVILERKALRTSSAPPRYGSGSSAASWR